MLRAWAPPRSFDFPTIISFLEKLGKFAKDYSALSLTYKSGGVFPIRHDLGLIPRNEIKYIDPFDNIEENLDLSGEAFEKLHDFVKAAYINRLDNNEIDISDDFISAYRVQFLSGTNTMDVVCPIDRLEGDESEVIELSSDSSYRNLGPAIVFGLSILSILTI
ncbi:MAG: hypothetical protein AB8G05_19540, partial [Oligoflexales bacterium]